MKYTQLGRTGLKVSRLVLGTMNFGPQTDEADSHAIMDAALDAGINFFDTANVYGWGENKGRTESIIGNWFAKGGEGNAATRSYSPPRCTGTWPPPAPRLAQPRQALRAQHPAGGGGEPQAAADRLHRPLPVPPHRPLHSLRGDLAGHRRPGPAGQDPLRRVQQLPRLQDRPGQRDRRQAAARTASSASSACTTSPSAAPRWRSSRPRRSTGSGSSPGRRCTADCWAV